MNKSELFPAAFYEKVYGGELMRLFPIINSVEVMEGTNITDYLVQINYPKIYKTFNPQGFCNAVAWNVFQINKYLSLYPTLTIRIFMDDEFICATFVDEDYLY